MLNNSLIGRRGSRLNAFTLALRDLCLKQGNVLVKMRNGNWCKVKFVPRDAKDEHPYDDDHDGGFRSHEYEHHGYWLSDGSSITAGDFDLIEFENN